MAKKRNSRNKIEKSSHDLLKPIDILKLGSEDDPCFGTQHDLLARECRECGDSEFCAIVNAQNLKKLNLDMEKERRFKDVEEADFDLVKKKDKAKQLIALYRKNGLGETKIMLKVWAETKLTKEDVKFLLKQ